MRTITKIALAGLLMAPFAAVSAQSPTPEGTTITNTATASWTDANGNTYTPVNASVSVTVGFLAGVDVTSPASMTPASPSTGNVVAFTINNVGNGTDSVRVTPTVGAGITVTGYRVGATTYATVALLNDALSSVAIPAGNSVVVEVLYTVAPGQGGQTIPVTLSATSRRDSAAPAGTDASTTNLIPGVARAVAVTPDGATRNRLPSNGTTYTETFTVLNNGNATDVFNLVSSASPGTTLSIVSVNGVAGSTGSLSLASGASGNVVVVYTVGNVAAGTTDQLRLTATSTNDASITDQGDATILVIRSAITMTKEVFRDNRSTAITAADRVLPGEYIQYRITVTSAGGAAAQSVRISDPLPSQVVFDAASGDAAGWTISNTGNTVTADLSGSLASSQSRFIWVRARVR